MTLPLQINGDIFDVESKLHIVLCICIKIESDLDFKLKTHISSKKQMQKLRLKKCVNKVYNHTGSLRIRTLYYLGILCLTYLEWQDLQFSGSLLEILATHVQHRFGRRMVVQLTQLGIMHFMH